MKKYLILLFVVMMMVTPMLSSAANLASRSDGKACVPVKWSTGTASVNPVPVYVDNKSSSAVKVCFNNSANPVLIYLSSGSDNPVPIKLNESTYRYAKWKCKGDTTYTVQGGPTSCKFQSLWKQYATDDCTAKCQSGRACGLATFTPYQGCQIGPVATTTQTAASFSFVSSDKGIAVNPGSGQNSLTQSITFRVTAADSDVYVLKGANQTGLNYGVNGIASANGTSTANIILTQALDSIDGMTNANNFLVPAGTSRTFVWYNNLRVATTSSMGYYQSVMTAINWNTSDTVVGASSYTNLAGFVTGYQYLSGNSQATAKDSKLANIISAIRALLDSLSAEIR
ncbi:MAG: hypothetical protein WCO03_01345 [bacterium]